MSIVARCTKCGFTWETRDIFDVERGAAMTLDVVGTVCVRCEGYAEFLDGTWLGTDNSAILVDGPEQSRAIFATFKKLVDEARKGRLTAEQVQTRAAELNEGLGRAVGILMLRYPKTAVFIFALIAMLKYMNLETKVDVNDLVRQVIERVDSEHQSPGKASGGHLNDTQDKQPTSDSDTPKKGADQKQGRIGHQHKASQTRRNKNRAKRAALRKRREEFNPR